ncbi:DUF3180 domain-containing protein [Compostimonas suwonensis]|uniref:Uncharacterized protein DUF3180 n=1 Tax=Compostimonas suwonensis TaxID=1048394 RepID=A0A2M9C527_9MICO|nr:DUF3180 domain-containing protein [Compostimonas suwonensis]PJJ65599.1 uncharacterized protein DUF3180 [Compostimonas suwonensis]
MRRTHATPVIGLGAIGLVVGFLAELAAAAAGQAIFIPPVSLPVTLIAIAAIVVGFAVPIRRATHGHGRRVDPFRAMRVALLAKACSLAGALLTGASLGVLIYLLSRSVIPGVGSIVLAAVTVAGAVILLVGGLVAEHLCTLPPGGDDDPAAGGAA